MNHVLQFLFEVMIQTLQLAVELKVDLARFGAYSNTFYSPRPDLTPNTHAPNQPPVQANTGL
jgi:hypothetical protein